jgi:phage N-6-adenine-methyltransferase
MVYSNTYPHGWTEAKRLEVEAALTKDHAKRLRQEWETPPDFWQALNLVYEFQVDVCASRWNAKCPLFIPIDGDALDKHTVWVMEKANRAWCNPGFANVLPWHMKAFEQAQRHPAGLVVVIGIPGASQEWYAFAQQHADEIVDLSPRVDFLAPWPLKQSNNNRESQLFIYRRKLVPTRPATRTLWNWRD